MNLLLRILLLVCCACLPMRAAVAHMHEPARIVEPAESMRVVVVSAHQMDDRDLSPAMHHVAGAHATHSTDGDCGCPHGPCSCCSTACGMHCCALPAGFGFDVRAPGATRLRPEPDALHDSLSRAPRLRPPIV